MDRYPITDWFQTDLDAAVQKRLYSNSADDAPHRWIGDMRFVLIACFLWLPIANISIAQSIDQAGSYERLKAFSCEEYFVSVGRPQCVPICQLDAASLCDGFVGSFFASERLGQVKEPRCEDGLLFEEETGWSVRFKKYEDSSSLYFLMDLIGPTDKLGGYGRVTSFTTPSERYRYTLTVRPNWKLHYSFDLQIYGAAINKKGFSSILQEGDRNTKSIATEPFGVLDDELFLSFDQFFKERGFPDCEEVRDVHPNSD